MAVHPLHPLVPRFPTQHETKITATPIFVQQEFPAIYGATSPVKDLALLAN
jgi:hypothetical protein